MIFEKTHLNGAWLIDLEPRGDHRGFFARAYDTAEFARHGLVADYPQTNTSFSAFRGTLRGLHFQHGEAAEAKLMRCIRGTMLSIIVDLRGGSPTYLQHGLFELSVENRRQLYVPPGFANAFLTLTDDVEVVYPVSQPYAPGAEGGVRYDDPRLGIRLPIEVTTISDKDRNWPLLAEGAPPIFA
ncbi:dTDP-4-dehydrorhamnose 3,5-epimerase [Aureimonas endophytica]|uniref:dTDP-4-dehydrorhamnose 3,5-epimerase n=1 Tax=Aureimonas endophytica TaxID=2027858 RepID=A0A916ZC24_9HYPH|nr:dTDP-4-dehydrorhamnose 3,5-epimerase family protein [Aureimonas endophytica]GGD87273.1 dTDP-4-dehydrorhamnose 3,5-epimerase [Aureimonas endophytica]